MKMWSAFMLQMKEIWKASWSRRDKSCQYWHHFVVFRAHNIYSLNNSLKTASSSSILFGNEMPQILVTCLYNFLTVRKCGWLMSTLFMVMAILIFTLKAILSMQDLIVCSYLSEEKKYNDNYYLNSLYTTYRITRKYKINLAEE